jgi:hypothetical protein
MGRRKGSPNKIKREPAKRITLMLRPRELAVLAAIDESPTKAMRRLIAQASALVLAEN